MTRHRTAPRIGVVGDFNAGTMEKFGGEEAHHFLNARYTRAIEDAGGVPWLLAIPKQTNLVESYLDGLDGLLFTGCGRHTDPAAYNDVPRFDLNLMPAEKQDFEISLYLKAREREMPILAICGGMQNINVALGGTLVQRIGEEVPDALDHMQATSAVNTVHDVTVSGGSLLANITGGGTFPVNTSHTQSVDRPGDGLTVSAVAPDGVVEAYEGDDGRLIGVQWHPEYLYPAYQSQALLFAWLVELSDGG